ncbi:putative T7SS-secreted protein, partial [Streptomyces sp. NPDC014983]|uniref:putative T7SS-secreted protein n=1 Tax=Streptomyces sp. NPDC014983 TaxID=3364933 RepID=UPI0036F80EA4
MRKVDSSGWQGEAGDAFREKFGVHPAKWTTAAEACLGAAKALESYADTVTWAQGQAREAVELYKKGTKASEDAVEAYNRRADAYNAKVRAHEDPGPKPEPFHDPGKADIDSAFHKLSAARKQRDTAATEARGRIEAALAHAPAEPPPLTRLRHDLKDGCMEVDTAAVHFLGGVVKGTAGLVTFVRGLNPLDVYNVTHPANYLQHVSMTLSGLLALDQHPDRALKGMWSDFKKDPSEFGGELLPQLFVGDGVGLEAGLTRDAAEAGLRSAAEGTLKDGARAGAEDAGKATARDTVRDDPNQPSREQKAVESGGTDPIDLATGRMYLPQTDVVLPGVLPLLLKRRVESGYHLGRWFGPSWSSTLDQRLEIDAGGVVLVTEDGLLLSYPHPAPGLPTLPSHGPRRPLDRVDGGYTVTDPETRRTWHFADRTEGLAVLEQVDDRNGNWITFEYDAEGTPLAVFTSAGQGVRVTTDSGRVTSYRLAATGEELKRFAYTDGDLTEVVNSSGLPLRFTYDDAGRITSWTDTNGRSYTYEYDERDRCVAEGGAAGHMTLRLTYGDPDPATGLRTTTATTGEGHTRRYLVNDAWQVVAENDPLGTTTSYVRDRYNRLLSTTDPLGHTTSFRYDEAGNLTSVVRPDGRESRAEYDALGLPVKLVNPDRTTVRQTFDTRGNRTSVTDPAGRTTHFAYDESGHPTSVTDPLGNTTTITCDRAGLPLTVTDPLGAVTRYTRDAFGRPVTITDATG